MYFMLWSDGVHNTRYGYKKLGNMICLWNSIVVCNYLICNIFFMIQYEDFLLFVDVNIVNQTILKPHIYLC